LLLVGPCSTGTSSRAGLSKLKENCPSS